MGVDAPAGDVVCDGARATFGEALVVGGGAIGIGVAVDVDESLVEFFEDEGNGVEGGCELGADFGAGDVEGDVVWHVENDVVALAGDGDAGALELLANGGFLLVHVVADASSGGCSESGSDEGSAGGITVAGVVADDRPEDGSASGSDAGTLGGVGSFSLAGVGVDGGAAGEDESGGGAEKECFFHRVDCVWGF